ncbi:hypothetical protein [Phenylobacterium sp.]|uniref:hypothetical protein n=1 Tax=Phenylobacterium sp. TaxID=1871053 RepID=UPI00286BEBA7|nr:hypothetical protein [Phenylobacterium sp.]
MTAFPPAVRHFGEVAREARASRKVHRPPHHERRLAPSPLEKTVVRLWAPLTPILWLLAPFAMLLIPVLYFVPRPWRVEPFAAVLGVGRLLLSLSGTDVDVRTSEAIVRIRIL